MPKPTAHHLLKSGKTDTLVIKKCFAFQENYETAFILRPNGYKTNKGNWMHSTHAKMLRRNNIVVCLFGQWYYLGIYDHALTETLSPEEYLKLPHKVCLLLYTQY